MQCLVHINYRYDLKVHNQDYKYIASDIQRTVTSHWNFTDVRLASINNLHEKQHPSIFHTSLIQLSGHRGAGAYPSGYRAIWNTTVNIILSILWILNWGTKIISKVECITANLRTFSFGGWQTFFQLYSKKIEKDKKSLTASFIF